MAITGSQGAQVGNYVLVRQLGVGGMAEVWLVRHQSGAQLRAMKFLNLQFSGIPEVEARFQAEGENQLVHPNIVRIYEVGQQDGSSFMVMDFIEGRDLEKIMDSRRGPLRIPEAVDIGIQILAGLGYAHASGIVHRDIKPSNVLVNDEGQAFLMDFGIAKVLRSSRSVTQVNARLGTPDYMSPEQIRSSRDVDARSDIYSFGCLFYELLTGWPPFDANTGYESVHDIQTAHVTVAPTPPMQRRNGLPPELDALVMHCLQKAKEDRPQTCEEIIVALDAYRASAAQTQARATVPVTLPGLTTGAATKPGFQTGQQAGHATGNPAGWQTPSQTGSRTGSQTGPPPPPPAQTNPTPYSSSAAKTNPTPPALPVQPPIQAHAKPQPQSYTTAPPPPPAWGAEKLAPQGPFHSEPAASQAGTTNKPVYGDAARTPTFVDAPKASQTAPRQTGGLQPVQPSQPVPAKSNRMMLTVVGAVLALAAAGGGAWVIFHKTEPTQQAVSPKPDQPLPPTNGGQQTPENPKPDSGSTVNPRPNKKVPETIKPPIQPPIKPVPVPVPVKLMSGTITWSGTIDNPSQQIVDIYLPNQRATAGTIFLRSAPASALPIAITVDSGNAKVMNQPTIDRNFSTFRIGVLGTGPQTVTLRWTELPHSGSTMPSSNAGLPSSNRLNPK